MKARASLLVTAALALGVAPALDACDALTADRAAGVRGAERARFLRASVAIESDTRRRLTFRRLGDRSAARRFHALTRVLISPGPYRAWLERGLRSPNDYVVRGSTLALGALADAPAAVVLARALSDETFSGSARFYAAGAFAGAATEAELEVLRRLAFEDPEARIRRAAQVGLFRLSEGEVLADLAKRASAEGAPAEQARASLGRWHRAFVGADSPQPAELISWARAAPRPPASSVTRVVYGADYRAITDWSDEDALRRLAIDGLSFRRAAAVWLWGAYGRSRRFVSCLRFYRRRADFERYGAVSEFNFVNFDEFYYSYVFREVVAFGSGRDPFFARRLRHELLHDALEQVMGRLPPWLAEGLCELFEVTPVAADGKLSTPPVNREWLGELARALDAGTLPAIQELLLMDGARFYGEQSALHYAAAWSLCYHLAVTRGASGRAVLRRLVDKRQGLSVWSKALRGAYSPERLEATWRAELKTLLGR